ncbi:Interleukin-1 receptor-associated kinase 1 [Dermatophagoides farinae]|uniref:non-specific serine/threonine protein kinase n=1 Tax=Dermatophagoides farinae TaxID=6954 RepID=A0A922HWY3_DERFA|nr:Interleukin-1 receptor-associated kinase 1 [Dermatophagoides farinae]
MLYSTQTTNSNYGGYQSQNISNRSPVVYVYELPYNIRKSICDLLDADNSWRELGGLYMGFNDTQLTLISHALYRSASPTNELLTKWESSNAKVSHLFIYLAQMKHHRALHHLLPFILNAKQSTLKNFMGGNSKYYDHHHQNHNRCKNNHQNNCGQSDEEKTLIDLQNDTKKAGLSKRSKSNDQKEIEYLLKIDDFKITYKELVIATDDFSKDNVLGSGGFGTVYIGDWKGTEVAIKKLKGLDNLTQALTELRILNCCRIDNILPLYAVSLDGPEPCLVYQYMSNGSLEDRLLCKGNTVPLTWIQRAKIGEGVARALNFLHTLKGNPFVHGDVKSANILLDPMFEPKLGDFGLARQVVKNSRNENSIYTHCTVSSVNGTSVYLPAEYLRQKILSPAVDVYSYGIVILEMATGRRAYDGKKLLINSVEDEYSKVQNATLQIQSIKSDNNNNQNQKQDSMNENTLEFLMDKRIVNLTDNRHLFNYLLELGRRCAHKTKSKRPIMVQILEYYNQCRATERIYQLCDKVIQNKMSSSKDQLSKTNVKNPIELQLWYDFVRKSCGTLSEVVFENFDAQVTKIIEDLVSSKDSNESTYYLDLLLCSKNRLSNKSLIRSRENPETLSTANNNNNNSSSNESSISSILSSSINTCNQLSNLSINNKTIESNNNDDLSRILKLINLDHNIEQLQQQQQQEHVISKITTMNDEKSSLKNNNNDDDDGQKNLTGEQDDNNDDEQQQLQRHSTPFIPLLTALGFDTTDFDRLIINEQNCC